jgi:hypothetical protein
MIGCGPTIGDIAKIPVVADPDPYVFGPQVTNTDPDQDSSIIKQK